MKPQITTEPGALSVAAFCQWAGEQPTFWLVWELLNAPQCVCGRSDCGGGCGLR